MRVTQKGTLKVQNCSRQHLEIILLPYPQHANMHTHTYTHIHTQQIVFREDGVYCFHDVHLSVLFWVVVLGIYPALLAGNFLLLSFINYIFFYINRLVISCESSA